MKVLDLGCAHGHVFEGWFASEEDFQDQRERGLITCPVCGDQRIDKRLSAPYVQTRRSHSEGAQTPVPAEGAMPTPEQQARLLRALRAWVQASEDVGERFVDEARAMHRGEVEARSIRGVATPQQAVELWEEGIAVLPLPDPALFEGPLH
jgi:hypothetical protein